jgi:hexokinase
MFILLDAVVERSARITASITAAAVIKSGEGFSPVHPVCIVCEGTTFNKTHHLRQRFEGYLDELLTVQRSIHFEICTPENAITIGTAAAAAIM